MISQEVRNALKILAGMVQSSSAPGEVLDNSGDCWAELIGEVIEIARQNQNRVDAHIMNGRAYESYMTKEEIIIRAIWAMDIALEDLGLGAQGKALK